MAKYDTFLGHFYRGSPFIRTFTLGNDWLGTYFDEVWFTVRTKIPPSNSKNDYNAIAQGCMLNSEIVFEDGGAEGTVTFPSARTRTWETGKLYFDLKGKVSTAIYTIDSGYFKCWADITRRTE